VNHGPRLTIDLPRGLVLRDPLLMSSGCWEFSELRRSKFEPHDFGGVITQAVTPEERAGNPGIRIQQVGPNWMNSVGLKNPGVEKFCAEQLPKLLEMGIGFFVNVAGHGVIEFAKLVQRIELVLAELNDPSDVGKGQGMLGYEVNLSCPNVDGANIATDESLVEQTVGGCRKATERFLTAKLSPNVTSTALFAKVAQEAGADAVTIANTYNGVAIDTTTRRSRFARPSAGTSGAPVLPLTLYHIWQCHKALPDLAIFGSGGITDTDSALQHLMAGARVLEIGSALFKNPQAPHEIKAGLIEYMDAHDIKSIGEIVGSFQDQ
jgi:dihydroorotate dehydrogenase (NAD+) catalytic subunit